MQNPNEDTEWNDILRSKGIIPAKEKEITEEQIVNLLEETITEKTKDGINFDKLNLDELDELEDSEDEAVLNAYREKRIAEMKSMVEKNKFGTVGEITAQDYVDEVNKAGKDIWVVLHLYKQGIPLCALINEHLRYLAMKFPSVKFLKAISTTCIPNYPDKNLPTIFIYYEGDLKKQLIGTQDFRYPDMSLEELEFMLSKTGAVQSDIKENPRPKIKDKLFSELDQANDW